MRLQLNIKKMVENKTRKQPGSQVNIDKSWWTTSYE